MLRFDERVAVVTGATHGIGRAYALMLAERGARVVINCRKDNEVAREVVKLIEQHGSEALVVAGDIGAADTPGNIVEAAMDAWGRIDIAISNAAAGTPSSLAYEDVSSTIDACFDMHVRSTLRMHQAAWPHMQRQKHGRLLATGSAGGNGYIALPGGYLIDYALCKSSLFGAVRQTAATGVEHNIKFNMVLPWAYSKMVDEAIGGTELGIWMEANVRPEQVAAAVAPLLHEKCPVTGEAITVGGGRVGRVFFAATRGIFDPDLTPEKALECWDKIMGSTAEDGTLLDAFEQTQPREEAVMVQMLQSGQLPDLSEIVQIPLKGGSKSMQ